MIKNKPLAGATHYVELSSDGDRAYFRLTHIVEAWQSYTNKWVQVAGIPYDLKVI